MNPLRVIIVGTNFGSKVHIPALRKDPRILIAGLVGKNLEKTKKLAEELRIPHAHDNLEKSIQATKATACVLAVPPLEQGHLLRQATQLKLHTFIEKPLGLSSKDGAKILSTMNEQCLIHAMDFEFLELESWHNLKRKMLGEKLLSAAIEWHVLSSAYQNQAPQWKKKLGLGGGTLGHLGSHSLYYIEDLFGPITELFATWPEDETQLQMFMSTTLVPQLQLNISSQAKHIRTHQIRIACEEKNMELSNTTTDYMKGFNYKEYRDYQLTLTEEDTLQTSLDGRIHAVGSLLQRWVTGILEGQLIRPNLKHGLRVQYLMEQCQKSQQEKKIISIDEVYL